MITLVFACTKEEPTDSAVLIDPANSELLSAVLIMPSGSNSNEGTPPSSTSSNQAPEVDNQNPSVISSNGSTAPLSFGYSNINGNLGGCYVQVEGASRYYNVPYSTTSGSSGDLQLPLGIPTNVNNGEFCVNFCVYDNNGLVSNIVNTCVNVLRLGTGALQISLSWNTPTDQDLYVTDPTGEIISYQNTVASSGGQLDRDDLDGYGPENIFWLESAPDGQYNVKVDDYEVTDTPNTFYITVNGPNQSRSFNGTTIDGNRVDVVSFVKSGDNLSF